MCSNCTALYVLYIFYYVLIIFLYFVCTALSPWCALNQNVDTAAANIVNFPIKRLTWRILPNSGSSLHKCFWLGTRCGRALESWTLWWTTACWKIVLTTTACDILSIKLPRLCLTQAITWSNLHCHVAALHQGTFYSSLSRSLALYLSRSVTLVLGGLKWKPLQQLVWDFTKEIVFVLFFSPSLLFTLDQPDWLRLKRLFDSWNIHVQLKTGQKLDFNFPE